MKILMAQANPTVGDLEGNKAKILDAYEEGKRAEVDFVMFPEMFLSGYPIQDLVNRSAFIQGCRKTIESMLPEIDSIPVGIGAPHSEDGKVYNSYFLLENKKIKKVFKKRHLPNYSVFDEAREFSKGTEKDNIFEINGMKAGFAICEDAWHSDVAKDLKSAGAEILLVPNGSPYRRNKIFQRQEIMRKRVEETGLPLVYLNMSGGQDDQVFDGGSFTLDRKGNIKFGFPLFKEEACAVEIDPAYEFPGNPLENKNKELQNRSVVYPGEMEQDYQAMTTGLHDYLHKSGFEKAVLGLSGGIDSALVAALATDALGADNVRLVLLPSKFTSISSLNDASKIAKNLGCSIHTLPIGSLMEETDSVLEPSFSNLKALTKENIQPRLRAMLLMAISNQTGEILLTTGNKSEVATGYTTLYGDMAGTYNPIKDLYKTLVFDICHWRNKNWRPWMKGSKGEAIPEDVINKPPSAELKEDQKDEDLLLPYPVMDQILELLVDQDLSLDSIVKKGFREEDVKFVENRVYLSEYKRFQSAPGVRLTERALWLDRRYPIINKWRDSAN